MAKQTGDVNTICSGMIAFLDALSHAEMNEEEKQSNEGSTWAKADGGVIFW